MKEYVDLTCISEGCILTASFSRKPISGIGSDFGRPGWLRETLTTVCTRTRQDLFPRHTTFPDSLKGAETYPPEAPIGIVDVSEALFRSVMHKFLS